LKNRFTDIILTANLTSETFNNQLQVFFKIKKCWEIFFPALAAQNIF